MRFKNLLKELLGGLEMLKRFLKDESGLETVEYAVIAGLILLATILTISAVGVLVNAKFVALQTALTPTTGT
jgi:Flp pilus assembly pilin Flp